MTMQADGIVTCVDTVAGAPGIAIGRSHIGPVRWASNHFARRLERPLCFVHDPSAVLRLTTNRYEDGQIVLITSSAATEEYLQQARLARVSYVFAGEDGMELEGAMRSIQSEFVLSLLVTRADGRTDSAFMAAGLVDQVSVLVFPGWMRSAGGIVFLRPLAKKVHPPRSESLYFTSVRKL